MGDAARGLAEPHRSRRTLMTGNTSDPTTVGPASDLVRLKRLHHIGHYDFEALCQVLDAGCICHVGYVLDGAPVVTPTIYWREGEYVYWHGSAASRMLETAVEAPVCISVAHLDGFVMARCAFDHSVHYRSVMLFGEAEKITAPSEKEASLRYFMETLFPGRWDMLRPMQTQEAKATTILRIRLDEGSAKLSSIEPRDLDDGSQPCWAGILPVRMVVDAPRRAGNLPEDIVAPAHIREFDIMHPQKHLVTSSSS
jgi:nitroimidazol reductase NimA-like FMN-containing flavoprotein (pyridoxamine 5'-phosphate oxidase superfamily)